MCDDDARNRRARSQMCARTPNSSRHTNNAQTRDDFPRFAHEVRFEGLRRRRRRPLSFPFRWRRISSRLADTYWNVSTCTYATLHVVLSTQVFTFANKFRSDYDFWNGRPHKHTRTHFTLWKREKCVCGATRFDFRQFSVLCHQNVGRFHQLSSNLSSLHDYVALKCPHFLKCPQMYFMDGQS